MARSITVMALALLAAGAVGAGCSRPGGPPADLKALEQAPPESRGLIGFSVQLSEATMCEQLGYNVDEEVLTDLAVRALAAAESAEFDRAAVEKVQQAARVEARAAYLERIDRPGKATTSRKFKAEIEALYGFYDNWCAEAAADELAGSAIKAPTGYDRQAAKDAAIAGVLKTASIMQPQNQR